MFETKRNEYLHKHIGQNQTGIFKYSLIFGRENDSCKKMENVSDNMKQRNF